MFSFICQTFPHWRSSCRSPLALYRTKSGVESSKQSKQNLFAVSYLVNRCGFAPEKALSVSNYVNFETPDKPDSVLLFLKNHGFTESQISKAIKRSPSVVLCDPQKTLLPKIDFFKSLGFSVEEFTHMLCLCPGIFKTNLKNQLLPTVDFLKNLLSSPDKISVPLKRYPHIFLPHHRALMDDNISLLREIGVPESRIIYYIQNQPRLFAMEADRFRKIVEEIKRMGFEPSKNTFIVAVHVLRSMRKLTWEKKILTYKKWGLSDDQILEAFGKNPWFMACSEEKVVQTMVFLVNKMGFKSSDIIKNPVLVMFSLKKRIVPRCLVFETLSAEGLLGKEFNILARMLLATEVKFLKKYVECYEEEVPNLLKKYHLLLKAQK